MKRMKLVVMNNNHSHETHGSAGSDGSEGGGGGVGGGGGGGGGIYECDNCRTDFPNKTTLDRHALFCRTLADIRRGSGGGGGSGGVSMPTHNDPLMPTPREMFVLIQELAAKYNKVKDELDVMKQWAKMVGRRIGAAAGSGAAVAAAGLDFTSIGRQKRQNMEVILNEEDAEHPDLAEARPSFAEWVATLDAMTRTDLNVVFNEDLVSGITAAILRVLSGHTAESGRSHLVPFKLADIKQGGFYIYDTAFKVVASAGASAAVSGAAEFGQDPPTRRWRAMEACEFQLMVRTFHKLLSKEFKKWSDDNWAVQKQMTQQRQKAASSYKQMMSVGGGVGVGGVGGGVGGSYQCSPAMASCDGMYWTPGGVTDADAHAADADIEEDVEPTTPLLSEDFATLYNKYADKMMGGALSDEAIVTKVRAKLWKDMKAWRL